MKLDHIGIAVKSLKQAEKIYRDALGLPLKATEEVADQKVRVAMYPTGESRLELLEPASDDSPIAKFLSKRGEGLHHLCLRVENLEATLHRLKAAGVRLIDEQPRLGADGCKIAFLHPSSMGGVLVELSERAEET